MNYDGVEPVTTTAIQLAILNLLAASGGPFHSSTLRLFQNNITPTNQTTLAQLTEATFDGYAAAAVTSWTSAYIDNTGTPRIDGTTATFIATDGTVVNTIYGWYLTTGTGSAETFVEAALFPAPIIINAASDGVTVVPTYGYAD